MFIINCIFVKKKLNKKLFFKYNMNNNYVIFQFYIYKAF